MGFIHVALKTRTVDSLVPSEDLVSRIRQRRQQRPHGRPNSKLEFNKFYSSRHLLTKFGIGTWNENTRARELCMALALALSSSERVMESIPSVDAGVLVNTIQDIF